MIKKIALLVAAFVVTVSANAQFQEGKGYIGASLTGLNLNYNGADGFNFGVEAKGGYLFLDNLMGLASFSYNHNGNDAVADHLTAGVGLRYYIIQNGLYLGLNGKLIHANHNYNDVMPGVEVGYAFYVNRSVTIEPAIYYDQSFRKHSDYSTIGLKVGIGIYLFDD
ncbi:MAG: outer membrane beta-barrel protein [Prevotella sp.]|nr:outer membrane beta-barrel protein [Prevotella sp.]